MKGQTKPKDTAPQNEKCKPYVCNGEGGRLHNRMRINRTPCPVCLFYRWKQTTQEGSGELFQKNRS